MICFEAIQNDNVPDLNKFLLAEQFKPCEIYRRFMCNVHRKEEETCFSQNNLYKWTKHGFVATIELGSKRQYMK